MAVSTFQKQIEEPPRFSNFVRGACKEAVADFRDVVAGLAHGLPLLLLVTVFLLMQAELGRSHSSPNGPRSPRSS